MTLRRLALVLCLLVPGADLVAAAPVGAQQVCDAPTAVSISAAPETFDLGETVELTVGVDAPCDPSVEHRVSVSTRPADDVPDCPVTPTPVTTLVVLAGRSATSTVTVRPLSSSEYLAALDGAVYGQLPSTTVTSRYPAPGTPPPRTTTTTGPAVAGQVRDVTVEGATCVVDLFARTARDGRSGSSGRAPLRPGQAPSPSA